MAASSELKRKDGLDLFKPRALKSTLGEFLGRIPQSQNLRRPDATHSAEGSQQGRRLRGACAHVVAVQVCKGEPKGPGHRHLPRSSEDSGERGAPRPSCLCFRTLRAGPGQKGARARAHTTLTPCLLPPGAAPPTAL